MNFNMNRRNKKNCSHKDPKNGSLESPDNLAKDNLGKTLLFKLCHLMKLFYGRQKFAQNYNFRTSEMHTSLAIRPHERFSSVTTCILGYRNFTAS